MWKEAILPLDVIGMVGMVLPMENVANLTMIDTFNAPVDSCWRIVTIRQTAENYVGLFALLSISNNRQRADLVRHVR